MGPGTKIYVTFKGDPLGTFSFYGGIVRSIRFYGVFLGPGTKILSYLDNL